MMSSAWLLLQCSTDGGRSPTTVPVFADNVVIGRGENLDVQIKHPLASRRHFTLTRIRSSTGPKALLTNVSRSGTLFKLANEPIRRVQNSLEIRTGDAVFFPDSAIMYSRPTENFGLHTLKIVFIFTPQFYEVVGADPPLTVVPSQSPAVRQAEVIQMEDDILPMDIDSQLQRVMTPTPPNQEAGLSSTPASSSSPPEGVQAAEQPQERSSSPQNVEARLSALENFVEQVVELYTCSICMELAYDPVTSNQCLHVFCGGCLSRWMFRTSGSRTDCPKCRTQIEVVMPNREWTTMYSNVVKIRPSCDRSEEERARMDEVNSFRGQRRFVVEEQMESVIMTQMERRLASATPPSAPSFGMARPSYREMGAGGPIRPHSARRQRAAFQQNILNIFALSRSQRRRGTTEDRP